MKCKSSKTCRTRLNLGNRNNIVRWRREWDSNLRYPFGDPPRGGVCTSYTVFCNMNVLSGEHAGSRRRGK